MWRLIEVRQHVEAMVSLGVESGLLAWLDPDHVEPLLHKNGHQLAGAAADLEKGSWALKVGGQHLALPSARQRPKARACVLGEAAVRGTGVVRIEGVHLHVSGGNFRPRRQPDLR